MIRRRWIIEYWMLEPHDSGGWMQDRPRKYWTWKGADRDARNFKAFAHIHFNAFYKYRVVNLDDRA